MSGARLDRPYVATFSTGASLPTAMVSGNLAFAGGDPLGAVVGLSAKLPFVGEGHEPEAFAIVTSPTGSYSMPYIRPGTYWVLAFKDVNGDGFTTLGGVNRCRPAR
ncbi:hypothetical protein HUU05_10155 [candidate division KSB1 bacterium]|nr:hypothetical protein [candidate division KSB1 bacterium]